MCMYIYIKHTHTNIHTLCIFCRPAGCCVASGLRAAAWQVAYGLLRGKWPAGCCVASGLRATTTTNTTTNNSLNNRNIFVYIDMFILYIPNSISISCIYIYIYIFFLVA